MEELIVSVHLVFVCQHSVTSLLNESLEFGQISFGITDDRRNWESPPSQVAPIDKQGSLGIFR